MEYRLGLDLGTNSLGWWMWKLKKEGETWVPFDVLDLGVRIFSDGREPQRGDPLAVERRLARSMRRRRDRKLELKRKLVAILVKEGLFPENLKARQALKPLNPYELRAKALKEKLETQELGRVLFHLGVRRGFKSNRKDKTDEKEQSETKNKIRGLWGRMKEWGSQTLGDFLWTLGSKNVQEKSPPAIRFRPAVSEFYPERKMYEEEFDRIRDRQVQYHKNVSWELIRNILFSQRPLKPVERGRCTFYPEEFRGWKALPSAQRFRYVQLLLNLKKLDSLGQVLPLTSQEFQAAAELFEKTAKVTTKTLRKTLGLGDNSSFNYQKERDLATGKLEEMSFQGNETAVLLRHKDRLGEAFDRLSSDTQDTLVEWLVDEDDHEVLMEKLVSLFPSLPKENLERTAQAKLPQGTMSVSRKFMQDCNKLMISEQVPYHEATKRLVGHHSHIDSKELLNQLPYYGEVLRGAVMGAKPEGVDPKERPEVYYGKINNPTVHIALNEVRKLINILIKKHGAPTQIVIELSRELPMGQKQKSDMIFEQKKNRKTNEILTRQINEALGQPLDFKRSVAEIRKHKLWVELNPGDVFNRCCVYCGQKISATDIYSEAVEIEHILPFSRTLLDSMSNLTVAHKRCNLAKGNQSPFEAFGHSPQGYLWKEILERASHLPVGKRLKFQPAAMQDFDESSGFIVRQLNDNRYLSKMAVQYLGNICPANQIWVANGRLTADLRYAWGLNSIIGCTNSEKDRADHRHHALDAGVIGLVDRRTVQLAARVNQGKGATSLKAPFEFPIPRNMLIDKLKTVVASHKPDHGINGRFFLDTAYGEIQIVEFMPLKDLKKSEWSLVVSPKVKKFLQGESAELSLKPDDKVALKRNVWVTRKPLQSLDSSKDLERIVDPLIRSKLLELTSGLTDKSPEFKKALVDFHKGTGIRHVRYQPKNQKFILLPRRGKWKEYKAYQVDDYLCVDVWFVPPHRNKEGLKQRGGYQGQFITRYEAMVYDRESGIKKNRPMSQRPHPGAKFICQLFKDDVISFEVEDADKNSQKPIKRVLGKVFGFSATQNKLDVRAVNASLDLEEWMQKTNSQIVDRGWPPQKGQNYLSINVIFGEQRGQIEFISIDGERVSR